MTSIHDVPREDERRLHTLKPGEGGVIEELCTRAESRLTERLMALGFVPGTSIRVLRRAPLGDPTEYEVRGTRISLRATEAQAIMILRGEGRR